MTYVIIPLPRRAKDISGQTFGRLIAKAPIEKTRHGQIKWLCICRCGSETSVKASSLLCGAIKSCGCLLSEIVSKRMTRAMTTHGKSSTSEYTSWVSLLSRCRNKNCSDYTRYGGRGIRVSARWNKFENFLLDMGEKPSELHTIDRIDVEGGYCKRNCRWATREQQAQNRRSSRMVSFKGNEMCVSQWARKSGVNENTLRGRLKRGWSIERALTAN